MCVCVCEQGQGHGLGTRKSESKHCQNTSFVMKYIELVITNRFTDSYFILFSAHLGECGENCNIGHGQTEYCEYGCCNQGCCSYA